MPSEEKRPFYLYGMGKSEDEISLGSLVLKDYANPTTARHYAHPKLTDDEKAQFAISTDLQGDFEFSSISGIKFKPGLGIADCVDFGVSIDKTREKIVRGKEGKRLVLKDPESFFHEQVLTSKKAQDVLTLWVAAAQNYPFIYRVMPWNKPKIWFLSGIYLLRGASVISSTVNSTGANASVNPAIVAAVGGPPIGPSIEMEHSNSSRASLSTSEWLVWAARYHAIDVLDFMHPTAKGSLQLRETVESRGALYFTQPPPPLVSLQLEGWEWKFLQEAETDEKSGQDRPEHQGPIVHGYYDTETSKLTNDDYDSLEESIRRLELAREQKEKVKPVK